MADLICLKGKLMQIARYGINKSADYSPFAKASFEEVVDVLIKASTFGEHDNMQGVSSNIMVGQHCNIGTNFFNVLLNEEEFVKNFRGNLKVKTEKKEIDLKDLKTIDITNDDFDSKVDITDQYQLPKKELPKLSKKESVKKNTIMSDVVEKNTENIEPNKEDDEDDEDEEPIENNEKPVKEKVVKKKPVKEKVVKEKVVKKKPVIKKIKK